MRIKIHGFGRKSLALAAGFALLAIVQSAANAQVSLGLDGGDNENTLCVRGGVVGISINDDCSNSDPLHLSEYVKVGPAANQIVLNGADGTATFGAAATFNNASATFNAGLTSSTVTTSSLTVNGPATVNGSSTFNGGVSVQSGNTVNFNGNRLQGVGTPTAGTDAANKQYVDDQNNAQDLAIGNQQTQIDSIVTVNNQQDTRLAAIENVNDSQQIQINQNTADISSLQSNVRDLRQRDNELAEGIAISLALEAPLLRSGQTFAMRGGWGNFDGTNAVGVTAAGAISQNVVMDAGVGWGTSNGTVAGKAGVTVGW